MNVLLTYSTRIKAADPKPVSASLVSVLKEPGVVAPKPLPHKGSIYIGARVLSREIFHEIPSN
jgi:hypothetical protein